jgi:hypothetical protein
MSKKTLTVSQMLHVKTPLLGQLPLVLFLFMSIDSTINEDEYNSCLLFNCYTAEMNKQCLTPKMARGITIMPISLFLP